MPVTDGEGPDSSLAGIIPAIGNAPNLDATVISMILVLMRIWSLRCVSIHAALPTTGWRRGGVGLLTESALITPRLTGTHACATLFDLHISPYERFRDRRNDCIAVTAQSSHSGGRPMSQRLSAGLSWPVPVCLAIIPTDLPYPSFVLPGS